MAILVETRVKKVKSKHVRRRLGLQWSYLDNYDHHPNGRIWILWDPTQVVLKLIKGTDQYIHCGLYNLDGVFVTWLTAIYAKNHLDERRVLWHDIELLSMQIHGSWILMGDFNNVLTAQDRIGGVVVHQSEYCDLVGMMDRVGLHEVDSIGDFYTWHNKHSQDPIYSRIDRVLGNMDWFQNFQHPQFEVLEASISDHAMLRLRLVEPKVLMRRQFRFINSVVEAPNFLNLVSDNRPEHLEGRPMYVLWRKLKRVQPVIQQLQRKFSCIKEQVIRARENLKQAQNLLMGDRMNVEIIEKVKTCTNDVLHWNDMEEKILQHKSKVDWLRLGDGNNAYFHAALKAKNRHIGIKMFTENGWEYCNCTT